MKMFQNWVSCWDGNLCIAEIHEGLLLRESFHLQTIKWYNIKKKKNKKTCWRLSRALGFLLGTLEKLIDFQIVLRGACYITASLEIHNVNISLWMELFGNFLPFVFVFCILYQAFPDILHTVQHKQNQTKATYTSMTDRPLECTLCIIMQTGTFWSIYCIKSLFW